MFGCPAAQAALSIVGSGRMEVSRKHQGRGRLFRTQGQQVVRAAVRLGLAPKTGPGAERLGRPRREIVGDKPAPARGTDRQPLCGILSEADLSDPDGRASEYGIWVVVCL